ncbi:MAG TPA: alginate lyase family protein, partial [Armatimonadota bacterium]|nr:alginate lyase family protein [Armatimonadota bacterium]
NGITRCDIDGRNRQQVFAVLHSFDHVGLPAAECIRRTLALLDLPGADAPDAVRDAYRAYYADLPARLPVEAYAGAPAEADAILEHRFTFNGVTHQLPDRIDWNADPGDCPHWPWEFNRFGFLRTLLGAFAATGERAYAEKAVQLILAFIADTDIADSFIPGPDPASWRLSVHKPHIWLSHLEVGFHLVAWGQALAALLPRIPDLLAPVDLLRIIKSVHDQLRWLEIIIPEGGHGNGLTSGAGCQLRALAHFPGLRDARALATVALDRLAATLDIQVLPDGVQHELTPHYHFCVCHELAHTLEALDCLGLTAPPRCLEVLRGMWRYVRQTLTPDGKQLAFNDGDGGLGAWTRAGLERPRVRALLGEDATAELVSTYYPYGGVMFLRQGSRHGRDELYLAFDGGPYGNAHQHEDALSFWLSAYGRAFIVDPGRYRYDHTPGSPYHYLMSTKAHSTIRVDNRDQHSRAHPEHWVARRPLLLTWEVGDDGVIIAGAVYALGYGAEQIPVRHHRTIRFVPDPGYWLLEDTL